MPFIPLSLSLLPAPAEQALLQIGIARNLVFIGQVETAWEMCGALFLEHAPVLSRDEALLGAYIECLLLLEMTALLPRLLQATYGTTVDMVSVLAGEWRVSFGNGRVLMVALAEAGAGWSARKQAAERATLAILLAAGYEPAKSRKPELVAA